MTMIRIFGCGLSFEPTKFQWQFAGRLVCVLVAATLNLALLAPLLMQATKVW